MMNMQARNQYLQTLVETHGYVLSTKKEKSRLLTEYCRATGQNRKYAIRKLRHGHCLIADRTRKRRSEYYDRYVRVALARLWEIFDYPCGQRLEPILGSEVSRLRKLGELECSDEVAGKLAQISARSISSCNTRKRSDAINFSVITRFTPCFTRKSQSRWRASRIERS